jgi:hypothetical protein
LRIEIGPWFIKQEKFRLAHESTRQGDAPTPLLTAPVIVTILPLPRRNLLSIGNVFYGKPRQFDDEFSELCILFEQIIDGRRVVMILI